MQNLSSKAAKLALPRFAEASNEPGSYGNKTRMAKAKLTPDGFHSRSSRKETFHTISLLEPHLRPDDAILDVGCGSAYILWKLSERYKGSHAAVDIVDCRKKVAGAFSMYDGVKLPFEAASFDMVMLNFVLHHVPNELKQAVLDEVCRVTRRNVFVLEDTPRNAIDRYYNRRHGEEFRRSIGSTADYGFYTQPQWETIFSERGFVVTHSEPIGRFVRYWRQPFARSCFILAKA